MSHRLKSKPKTQYKYLPKSKKSSPVIPIIILIVIILASIAVAIAIFSSAFTSTKTSVENQISSLTENYYENYLYDGIVNADSMSDHDAFEKAMQKYAENGFGVIHLRQILHYNNQKTSSDYNYITNYCDENKTYIKIYPEPPYERKSYRIEYYYSCNF